jgi:hypothetical protein
VSEFAKGRKPLSSPFRREDLSSAAGWEALSSTDLVIAAPTHYQEWKKIEESLPDQPQVEHFGEYGLIDSPHFHPETAARCMGLHFLEKGVVIPEDLDRTPLVVLPHRYLGYVTTKRGFVIFLAMVCAKTTGDAEVIVPKLDAMFLYMEAIKAFAAAQGVRCFELYMEGEMCPISIQEEGKVIKIFFRPHIEREEFLTLLKTSSVVGCRGNQSLMEAIACRKPLFYDPVKHNVSFLYDLIGLVRDRLPELFPLFSLFTEALEEDVEGWLLLGEKIAFCMRDTFSLFDLLQKEYCFNPVLEGIIKRRAYIKAHPDHLAWEQKHLEQLSSGTLPFPLFYRALKEKIDG